MAPERKASSRARQSATAALDGVDVACGATLLTHDYFTTLVRRETAVRSGRATEYIGRSHASRVDQ